jgi:surfeit locus 1 family protein
LRYTVEYTLGRYRIRFNFWYLIIFLVVQTLLNELGFWQLSRAKEKQTRIYQLEKGSLSVLTSLNMLSNEQVNQFQTVDLQMELVGYDIFLLDNKMYQQQPGYQVLNVARDVASNKLLLVNRGWIYAGTDRARLPLVELPNRNWHVKGRVYPITAEAISTSSAAIERTGDIYRLPVLDMNILREIEARIGSSFEPYVVRLNSDSDAALGTSWAWTNMSPEKHLAYAIQWFALALAFLIVSLVVCVKKR